MPSDGKQPQAKIFHTMSLKTVTFRVFCSVRVKLKFCHSRNFLFHNQRENIMFPACTATL